LATSLPAQGSVIARQIDLSPFRHGATTRSFNSFDANLIIGGKPILIKFYKSLIITLMHLGYPTKFHRLPLLNYKIF